MTIKFIYKIFPVFVFYTNWFMPKESNGYSYAFIVVIRPTHENSNVLLDHELIHSKQFLRTLGLMSPLYYLSFKHRLIYELEAYQTLYDYKLEALNPSTGEGFTNEEIEDNIAKIIFENYKPDKWLNIDNVKSATKAYYADNK